MGCCTSGGSSAGSTNPEVEGLFRDAEPVQQARAPTDEELRLWAKKGGDELEEPLREGWVKLVRASWLVKLAESGGVLRRRQDLPQKAFIGLDELKTATCTSLPIIVLSYPWLQPGHPDPHGENLRVIAKALKLYIEIETTLYGVLIDFTALFQADRTKEEKRIFKLALPELNRFYSHPGTIVLKVTQFPPGYPKDPSHRYVLPAGANTVEYAARGWCFAESAMSGLVKDSRKVLDLGHFRDDHSFLRDMIGDCRVGRAPPMHPEDFRAELDKKTFTSKKDDFERVAGLYSAAFQRLLGSAKMLDYGGLAWGPDEVRQLVRALRENTTLEVLWLRDNRIGSEGAISVAEALHTNTSLKVLKLQRNNIGPEGGVALAQALRTNASLEALHLTGNNIGPEGGVALAQALRINTTVDLYVDNNSMGPDAEAMLREAGGQRVSF